MPILKLESEWAIILIGWTRHCLKGTPLLLTSIWLTPVHRIG